MASFRVKFNDIENDIDMNFDDPNDMKVTFGERVETVTSDYTKLNNLPQINSVELIGDKSSEDLRLQGEMDAITNIEINSLFN